MNKQSRLTIAMALFLTAAAGCQQARSIEKVSPDPRVQKQTSPADRKPLELPLRNPNIVVRKSERRLDLYSDRDLLRTYKIGLGFNPVADKVKEGDGATPEGDFYIFVKNNRSAYYLSLGLSYPNAEDAERGLRDGLTTKAEHDAILEAIKKKTAPPQYTNLGGLIYIHGHGARSDWTWGCVALENDDVKELYDAVVVGTPVRIVH
jgi:murein L,D-transpeptidase YafK